MALLLVGINHNTATIELREKVAFPPERVAEALSGLLTLEGMREVVIVSTCNRTELYLAFNDVEDQTAPAGSTAALQASRQEMLIGWLARYHGLDSGQLRDCAYFHLREDAVRHLMRVACGLDSMVLGEPQILGQIKSAYAVSRAREAVGPVLGRAFQEAFSIAKKVRTDTAIGENPVSVAYAAVTLAERIFSDLDKLHVLLIGAGRTVELVARHLAEKGVRKMVVANRTLGNAMELASQFEGRGVLLAEIPDELAQADIVVSSTNSTLPLLGKGTVEKCLRQRRHRPMLLVDLAVPRDIEAEVNELDDAYLYSVDDISDVIEDNQKSREEAAAQADQIIEAGVDDYLHRQRSLNAVSTLRAFRGQAERLREQELERALKALERGEPASEVLQALARGLTNKLIHSPSVQMKKASAEGRDELLRLTQELFDLETDQDQD